MINSGIKKGEIVIYKAPKGEACVEVRLEKDTVWLTLNQIAILFDVDKSGTSRHIKNIYNSGELSEDSTVAKIATVQREGNRQIERKIEHYNLDVVLSVGYRVNSKRATQFRIWATKTLKNYLVKGYVINEKRLLEAQEKFKDLQGIVAFLKNKSDSKFLSGQEKELFSLLADYSKTLSILEQYDARSLPKPKGSKAKFILKHEDCAKIISDLKIELMCKKEASDLFGIEVDDKFKGVMGNIYQTFGGKELYTTIGEKATHLLYFGIKDHPFSDGNKRISSFLFVYFLNKNNFLRKQNGEKKINDNALV